MSISAQPSNQSLAQPTKFKLNFERLPFVTFFCQTVNIPGVATTEIPQNTPFVDLYSPGEKLVYDPLQVTFLVDEEYRSWFQVHDWLRGLTFPEDFKEYDQLKNYSRFPLKGGIKGTPQFSDAVLTLYSNQNNPTLRITYKDCFPTALGGINLNTQESAENTIAADATFRYSYFTIERV